MSGFNEGLYESDLSLKHPVESQIQSTLSFVQAHEELMNAINKLNHNAEVPNNTVNLNVNTTEHISTYDIIKVCIYFDGYYFLRHLLVIICIVGLSIGQYDVL
jgi:hypothetical protein